MLWSPACPREAQVDGAIGVLVISFRPAIYADNVAAGDVEVHAGAALVGPVAYFGKSTKFQPIIQRPCLNYQAMGVNTGVNNPKPSLLPQRS